MVAFPLERARARGEGMKMAGRIAIGTAAACVLLFLGWGHDFLAATPDPPAGPVEAAVVLAGPPAEDRERLRAAVECVRSGRARLILLPFRHRALGWEWFLRTYRIDPPLPEERVIIGREVPAASGAGPDPGGTFAEARATIELMRRHGLRSAIVLSSSYHMRRARLAFRRADPRAEFAFAFLPVPIHDPRDPRPWWRDAELLARVAGEYVKLAGAFLFYR